MAKNTAFKIEEFFSSYKRFQYKARELILQGDDPTGVYYIYKGHVRLYSISASGQELTFTIFKKGDLFPIRWAFTDNPHTYFCEAITPFEVAKAPKEKLVEFFKKDAEVSFELLSGVLQRLGGLLERMEYAVFGNAYQKVASILVICAERFGTNEGAKTVIKLPLTHKDIANLLGLTRETASVEIERLQKLGVCLREGHLITIVDLDKLKNEANWNSS